MAGVQRGDEQAERRTYASLPRRGKWTEIIKTVKCMVSLHPMMKHDLPSLSGGKDKTPRSLPGLPSPSSPGATPLRGEGAGDVEGSDAVEAGRGRDAKA